MSFRAKLISVCAIAFAAAAVVGYLTGASGVPSKAEAEAQRSKASHAAFQRSKTGARVMAYSRARRRGLMDGRALGRQRGARAGMKDGQTAAASVVAANAAREQEEEEEAAATEEVIPDTGCGPSSPVSCPPNVAPCDPAHGVPCTPGGL